jgi:hypothetical protein
MGEEERETRTKNTDNGYTRKLFSNLFEREKPEDKASEMCGLMPDFKVSLYHSIHKDQRTVTQSPETTFRLDPIQ